jgi:UDP-3-O-[3-hydroxymyristoyl] glucosamine N-acyltransferase
VFTVDQVCQWIGGRVVNADGLPAAAISGVRVERPAPLARARANELAFFFSKTYQHELPTAKPGILVTGDPFVKPLEAARLPLWRESAVVSCADPYLAMAILSEKFAASGLSTVVHASADRVAEIAENFGKPQIHATAVVDPTAELAAGVEIGARAVVSEHVRIGAGSILYPGVFVGPGAQIGERCVLFPNVTVYEQVEIGHDVRIHAGSVLGADGFGYAPRTRTGSDGKPEVTAHQKIYHLGRVVVGDGVEIGALSCVDRGTIDDTRIGRGAKLDNHVHVGHNAEVAEGAIICGGVCLAGNASVGKWAYVAGMVGIINHVHVGDGAKVGAMSLLTKDVPPGTTVAGNPQREYNEHFRAQATLSRLARAGRSKRASEAQGKGPARSDD